MGSTHEVQALARTRAQEVLAQLPQFHEMPWNDKLSVYKSLVDEHVRELSAPNGADLSGALAGPPKPKRASDLINDRRHENRRIDQAGELAGEFIENVDFPKFVRDLLKGVFDANLQVTIQQMEAYQKLLKTATKSVAEFANAVDNTAAFGYLAENQGDDFSIDFDDNEKSDKNPQGTVLTTKDGQRVDIGDNEIKAKIMDAKIAMAKEQRALLRETILMGISRLVVERGKVKASVLFDIKAGEKIDKADKAAMKEAHSSGTSMKASGGLIGSIFGGPSGGHTRSDSKTQISISSAKSTATTSLEAKLAGEVEIIFKRDYFKLDNFASMYSGVTAADRAAVGGAPGAVAPLPPGPPALPPRV
ncbi:MAG: hypothetical protein IT361_11385 [Gemmatimonadaceae bacterium]|nr:hypothetical protein [Gemmatimonadaceae bacterium]